MTDASRSVAVPPGKERKSSTNPIRLSPMLDRFTRVLVLMTSMVALLFSCALAVAEETPTEDDTQSREWPVGHYPLVEGSDLIGELKTTTVKPNDTLLDIGRRYGIGYEELRRANLDVRVWNPDTGTKVTLPTQHILPPGPREGVVVNVAEMRLYYYPPITEGEPPRVETYPISIGRVAWQTPLGETRVTTKVTNPAWYPPKSIIEEHAEQGNTLPNVVPPGPDNPLGEYAILLDIPGYLIHGTNRPDGIGMRVTHGCIRMLPEDIERLFPRLPVGTTVRLIDEPVKYGWSKDGILHVQAYPSLDVAEGTPLSRIIDEVSEVIKDHHYPLDYARLPDIIKAPGGQPQPLTLVEVPVEADEPEPVDSLYDRLELHPALHSQLQLEEVG